MNEHKQYTGSAYYCNWCGNPTAEKDLRDVQSETDCGKYDRVCGECYDDSDYNLHPLDDRLAEGFEMMGEYNE